MNTITSKTSLIYWDQNKNKVNYFPKDPLFLKENYIHLFQSIVDDLTAGPKFSFVKMWIQYVENEISIIDKKLKACKLNQDDRERILNKFRGNTGEIFAEAFFNAGYMAEYCENNTYIPVDPTNERFVDATAISCVDGLPIGIQIKNYKEYNLIPHEIFQKAAAEDALWLRHDKRIPKDKIDIYLNSPHQYLFSFTESRDCLKENYFNAVVFIGPNEIDSKKLQGDMTNGVPGKARFFQNIVDEIISVN